MSTAIQSRQSTTISEWSAKPESRERIQAAIGNIMDADTFTAHMITAFQHPDVCRCTTLSQATALMECAALGLLPTLNQVKLIPYKDTIKAMPQWQGYKALMERNPAILEVQAVLVHVTDLVTYENGEMNHKFNPFNPERVFNSSSDLQGGYAKITYRDGRPPKYHFVTSKQIEKAQKCAQTQNVWKSWYEQMAIKTIYRDCYARRAVPIDPLIYARLEKAVRADDAILGNDPGFITGDKPRSITAKIMESEQPKEQVEHIEGIDQSPDQPQADEMPIIDLHEWNDVIFQAETPERLAEIELNWNKLPDSESKEKIAKAIFTKRDTFRPKRGDRADKNILPE